MCACTLKCRMMMIPKLDAIVFLGCSRCNICIAVVRQFQGFMCNAIYDSDYLCSRKKVFSQEQGFENRQKVRVPISKG